jgi:xanthine dehydrogenase accessory factor
MHNIYSKIDEVKRSNTPAALCIVTDTSGSTPRKQGAKMIVYTDGSVFGTIGGGSIEKDIIERAIKLIEEGKTEKCVFNLGIDLGMHCGGVMEVFIEPICPERKLFIFGAGHIGKALASFARELDFAVTMIDPRENIFLDEVFLSCQIMNIDYFEAINKIKFDANSYIVIVTPKHVYDEDVLAQVFMKPHAYIGMIGSKRKIELLKDRFTREKIMSDEEINSIDMPIGLKMHVETPQEIAISILAKLIDVRNSINNPK